MLLCALLLLLLLAAPAAGHTLPGKLTLADIARATQEGGNVRLATALQRPRVSFAALGGSITTGHGATTHNRSWWPTFERLVRARGALGDRELAFHNGAVAATEPDFAALCLNTLLPADVDVVFVEFDVNCPGSTPEDTLRYELLVRKVLRLPRSPAVVIVHVLADHQKRFQDSNAETTNVLVPFYQLSAVSLRDAYWHHGAGEVWASPRNKGEGDKVHPGDLGCEVMAELASHLVASYALKAHLRAGAAGGSDAAAPAPPLREDAVFGADAEDDAVCVHSAALRPMETRDWRLVEEHDKWGLAATAAGAPLDVSFAPSEAGPGLFQLAYLESYDPAWGQVAVSCAGACSCAATIVDAHKEGGHTSVEAIARLPLSSRAGEGRCTVRLTLLGGRFKVLGVIASRRVPNRNGYSLFAHIRLPPTVAGTT